MITSTSVGILILSLGVWFNILDFLAYRDAVVEAAEKKKE